MTTTPWKKLYQHLDGSGPEISASDHVEDSSRGASNDVLSIVKLPDVLADVSASDASVTLDGHVIPQSQDDLKGRVVKISNLRFSSCRGRYNYN